MNRFVKHNQLLVTVLAVAGAIIFVLLVYSGIVIYQVGEAYSQTEACSKEIIRLRRKHPSPVEANKKPIQEDMLNYRESVQRFYSYFGRPYEVAANRFLTVLLNIKDASILPDKRKEFVDAYRARVHSGSNANSEFIAFRESYNQDGRWEEATREFVKAMAETSSDIHFGDDADRIALVALSLPYSLQNSDMMQRYLDNCRERFSESILVQKDAQDFGLAPLVADTYEMDDYPLIVYHLDTISDMVRRTKLEREPNMSLFLSHRVFGVEKDGARILAAKAVDLRLPLKPALPAELQEITPPRASAIETWVLLNVERMNAMPAGIDFPLFLALATASPSAAAPSAAGATGASGAATSFLTSSLIVKIPLSD